MSNPEAHLRVDSDGKVLGPVDDTSYRDDGESVPMSMEEKASADAPSPTPGDRCCYDAACSPGFNYNSCNNFDGSDTEAGCKNGGCLWITSDYYACTETSLTSDQWIAAGWNASDTTTPKTCASWKAQASTSAFDSNCQLGVSKTPNSPVFDACRTICGEAQCSAAPTPAPTPTPTTPTPRPTPQYPQCSANGGQPSMGMGNMDAMSTSYGTEWRTAVTNERHCNTIGNKVERPDEWPDPNTNYASVYSAMESECIHKYMQMSTLMNSPYPDGSDGTLSQPKYYCKWESSTDWKGCYKGDQCDDSWGPLDLPYSPVPTPLPNPVPGR